VLQGANLTGANLEGATLRGAVLAQATLDEVSLLGASVTEEQLATARSLRGTILPDGRTLR